MANPTTNFGWVMPTSSSLVTNLPADFNTFGQGVDTSMAQLKGGTTGQILSKTSATDMAFTWVTPTDQTPLTTKGDLFTFSTVDARLAVGTNGQTLVADSTASTGLKWATASGSSPSYTLINTGGTALTGATSITVSGISGKNSLLIWLDSGSAGANSDFLMTLNSDSTTKYNYAGMRSTGTSITTGAFDTSGTAFGFGGQGSNAADIISCAAIIDGANAAGVKTITFSNYAGGTTNNNTNSYNGFYAGTSTISSVTVTSDTGNWDAGTIYVYGA